jgi:hypothetical protein
MDENLKQQLLPAIIVFCWTVLGWVLYRYLTSEVGMSFEQFALHLAIGAGIGLVTGGVALGVTMMRK